MTCFLPRVQNMSPAMSAAVLAELFNTCGIIKSNVDMDAVHYFILNISQLFVHLKILMILESTDHFVTQYLYSVIEKSGHVTT